MFKFSANVHNRVNQNPMAQIMKVLIVEDSVLMARMIRRTIKSWADEICECDDNAQAFVLYSEQRPDWVLMTSS
ncbi:MAG: hypothetical protein M3388_15605 [Acidobacteriota bacterium]|nr:hypothetical protein [Acidobacteriota bacterium]